MNFKDLLNFKIESSDYDAEILCGCYYNHVPEIEDQYSIDWNAVNKEQKIRIDYIKNHSFDCRRVWQLYKVIYNNQVVMICKNAGREGDDHYGNKIINKTVYKEMIGFIKSFSKYPNLSEINELDLEEDCAEFIKFYDYHLEGYFDRW